MNKKISIYIYGVIAAVGLALLGAPVAAATEDVASGPVYVIRIEGAISPGTAGFLKSSLQTAVEEGAQAFLIELDTPGGLAQSMRTMVKDIMNAPIPVIVYVSPVGAQAASAGVMVTMAADVAAMAPGTNIGAAHPVSAGGQDIPDTMQEKVVNDMVAFIQSIAKERGRNTDWAKKAVERSVSITADEAVTLNVVDLVAANRAELLAKIHGREIKRGGLTVTLDTAGAEVVTIEETFRDRFLRTLADPNIAYILMMLGLAGLYFELSHPGAIFPGVIGGIALILAFYSFQTLTVNYAGLMLIIMGIILLILEMKVPSFGMLTVGGLICLTLGSIMLFKTPEQYAQLSLGVMIPVLLTVSGFFVVVTGLVVRAQTSRDVTGTGGLVGETGPVKSWEGGRGKVYVHGELWHAVSDDHLSPGDRIEVATVEGLRLTVRKKTEE